jgi:Fe-S-cluster-containing dehydrogenase component
MLPLDQRKNNFNEVSPGFTEEAAIEEAKRCLNCAGHLCLDVCSYDAPQFEPKGNTKMQKCDLCIDRLMENKKTICVDACHTRAMDVGLIEELRAKYGDIKEAEGFVCSNELNPSIIFKPKKGEKDLPVQKTVISPQNYESYE